MMIASNARALLASAPSPMRVGWRFRTSSPRNSGRMDASGLAGSVACLSPNWAVTAFVAMSCFRYGTTWSGLPLQRSWLVRSIACSPKDWNWRTNSCRTSSSSIWARMRAPSANISAAKSAFPWA